MTDGFLEIEVKFHLVEPDLVIERLLAAEATSSGRLFEKNIRFDDASQGLKKRDMLLRLRSDDRARLTFKSTPSSPHPGFKVHRELEVEVSDFKMCQAILEALGFVPKQVYEKWRETFVLNNTKCLIDTMPYGVFLEIEGEKASIREIANQLDLPWEKRILLNYLEIFETIKKEAGLRFTDITFENFDSVKLDIREHVSLLYATEKP
jgi:adenylate cyclase class 2